ncbi:hypothetical protein GGD67_002874 [Bradyrhizobium sp. IAR9]|uniref:hypothetical protein n=1 Tax=Bradyrhizobium sp. IAR9 TaxID=2663841 RepID=UPI0015C956CD|nr:hypothetical protein [Bradyrhizobium sp. IAR9]NYG45416.1 hypothetical protein [Bradyrhizobium sp. IAR9]
MLRLVMALEKPTDGNIRVFDESIFFDAGGKPSPGGPNPPSVRHNLSAIQSISTSDRAAEPDPGSNDRAEAVQDQAEQTGAGPRAPGEVLDVVRGIAHETKVRLLIVTHEMRFSREVSDRIAVFDAGRIFE